PLDAAAMRTGTPAWLPPRGPRRMRVALLSGCVQHAFFSEVNTAAARVLSAFRCEVLVPPGQPCCGALELHSGREAAALRRVRAQPRALLAAIPGLELVAIAPGENCCGSAGVYNLVEPEAAGELGRRTAARLLDAAPEAIAAANPGCLLQIGSHLGARRAPLP